MERLGKMSEITLKKDLFIKSFLNMFLNMSYLVRQLVEKNYKLEMGKTFLSSNEEDLIALGSTVLINKFINKTIEEIGDLLKISPEEFVYYLKQSKLSLPNNPDEVSVTSPEILARLEQMSKMLEDAEQMLNNPPPKKHPELVKLSEEDLKEIRECFKGWSKDYDSRAN